MNYDFTLRQTLKNHSADLYFYRSLNYAAHVELTQMNQHTSELSQNIKNLATSQINLQGLLEQERKSNDGVVNTLHLVTTNLTNITTKMIELEKTFQQTFTSVMNENQQLVRVYQEISDGLKAVNTNFDQFNNTNTQINSVSQKIGDATKALSEASAIYDKNTSKMVSAISKLYGVEPSVQNKRDGGWWPWK